MSAAVTNEVIWSRTTLRPEDIRDGHQLVETFIGHCAKCGLFQARHLPAVNRYGVLIGKCQTQVVRGGRHAYCEGPVGRVNCDAELQAAFAIGGWEAVRDMIIASPERYRP